MNKYYCEHCDKEIKKGEETYNVNDEAYCESCFNDATDRAENAYDNAREEGRI